MVVPPDIERAAVRTPRLPSPSLLLQPLLGCLVIREHPEQCGQGEPFSMRLAGCFVRHLFSLSKSLRRQDHTTIWATGYIIPLIFNERMSRVHPRVGGGARYMLPRLRDTVGPSPRGRGSRATVGSGPDPLGSIPAWAGEPAALGAEVPLRRVHPRVGGGAASIWNVRVYTSGPSPRGRGSHVYIDRDVIRQRSIPAWAGEPVSRSLSATRGQVHPRVGGGASSLTAVRYVVSGPSPRGRGSLRERAHHPGVGRSIPAWAGEPAAGAGADRR